jgi:hypothetical protein
LVVYKAPSEDITLADLSQSEELARPSAIFRSSPDFYFVSFLDKTAD